MKKHFYLLPLMVFHFVAIFASQPIATFADHTKVLKLFGGGEYQHKVIVLENPDSTITFAVISDPENQITKGALAAIQGQDFPYRDLLVYGERHQKIIYDGHPSTMQIANIRNGIDDGYPAQKLDKKKIASVKEWMGSNGCTYTLSENGSGSVKYTLSEQGYAFQVAASVARGSNQYSTKYKSNIAGGVTGGYTFVLTMDFQATIEWNIYNTDEGQYLIITQKGKPSVLSSKIVTSMDDDTSVKTPTLKAYQWVKEDVKYNSDVDRIRQKFLNSTKVANIGETVKGSNENTIILSKKYVLVPSKQKERLASKEQIEKPILDYFYDEISDFRFTLRIDWTYQNKVKARIPELLSQMVESPAGNYLEDYEKDATLREKWNKNCVWFVNGNRYYIDNDLFKLLEKKNKLISELAYVSDIEVIDYKLGGIKCSPYVLGGDTIAHEYPCGVYTCRFSIENAYDYLIQSIADVYVIDSRDKYGKEIFCVALNESFKNVEKINGEYEYIQSSIGQIKQTEDSLRNMYKEHPVFSNFDEKTYNKYKSTFKLTKNHEKNLAFVHRLLEYQDFVMSGIIEYDSTMMYHQQVLKETEALEDISKAYSKYFKSLKLIWEANDPRIDLSGERNIMKNCIAFSQYRQAIIQNDLNIKNMYSSCKNILKAYTTYYKGIDFNWKPEISIDYLKKVIEIQNDLLSVDTPLNLQEIDKAFKKDKDYSIEHAIMLLKQDNK